MSASAIKAIRFECRRFCRIKHLSQMEGTLVKLALRSYYAMPAKDRDKWSLEEVMKQGLADNLPRGPM